MRKFLILILIILPYCSLSSQNTTNSPTSMFGIGEIAYGEGGQYAGFGGAGIALRGGTFINYANPSAITALDSARFIFDMGVKGAYRIYRQTGSNSNSVVGNLNNMSIGFRLNPKFYVGVFLNPVTSCGYAATIDQDVVGSTNGSKVASLFEGSGGLSKMGLTGAAVLFKNFSVGASASYVAGTITQDEIQSTATAELVSKKQSFYLDLGAQYQINIDKKRSMLFGLVYGLTQPLHQSNTLTAVSGSGGTAVITNPAHASGKGSIANMTSDDTEGRFMNGGSGITYWYTDSNRKAAGRYRVLKVSTKLQKFGLSTGEYEAQNNMKASSLRLIRD